MPRVPESPGVTVLPQGDYGTVQYSRPQINMEFTDYGQAAGFAEQGFALKRDKLEKEKLKADEDAATDVVNQWVRRMNESAVGENGWLHEQEADIRSYKDRYNGRGFTEVHMSEGDDLARELVGTLTSPRAREIAIRGISNKRPAFYSRLAAHEGQQLYNMRIRINGERAALGAGSIEAGGDPDAAFRDIQAGVRAIYDIQGRNLGSRATEFAFKKECQRYASQAAVAYAKAAVQNKTFETANAYLNRLFELGALDGDVNDTLRTLLGDAQKAEQNRVRAADTTSVIRNDRTPSGIIFNMEGGIPSDIVDFFKPDTVPDEWVRASKNPMDPLSRTLQRSVQIEAIKKGVTEYGTEGFLAAISFKNATAFSDAVKKLPPGWTVDQLKEQMTEDERRTFDRKLSRFQASQDSTLKPSIAEVLGRVEELYPTVPQEDKLAVAQGVFDSLEKEYAAIDLQNSASASQLVRRMEAGNFSLDGIDMSNFTVAQRRKAEEGMARARIGGVSGGSVTRDPEKIAALLADPKRLKNMSATDFFLLRFETSDEDWQTLNYRRADLAQGGLPDIRPNEGVTSRVLANIQRDVPGLDLSGPDGARVKLIMTGLIDDTYMRLQSESGTGKQSIDENLAVDTITKMLKTQVTASGLFSSTTKALASLSASDIPEEAGELIAAAEGVEWDDYDPEQKVGKFAQYRLWPERNRIPVDVLSLPLRAQIRDEVAEGARRSGFPARPVGDGLIGWLALLRAADRTFYDTYIGLRSTPTAAPGTIGARQANENRARRQYVDETALDNSDLYLSGTD